jgi:hypothetical protein
MSMVPAARISIDVPLLVSVLLMLTSSRSLGIRRIMSRRRVRCARGWTPCQPWGGRPLN